MFYPLERIGFDAVTKSDRGDSRQGGDDAPGDGTLTQWLKMSHIIISLYRLLSGPLRALIVDEARRVTNNIAKLPTTRNFGDRSKLRLQDQSTPQSGPAAVAPLWRLVMLRNFAFVVGYAVVLGAFTAAPVPAAQFGTAEEAKAMLERAVAAVKEDKAKALDMFNNGEGGFKDRDLYVWCANASDGIVTAQPYVNRGKQLRDIKGKHGAPFGETIMQNATEGTIKETTYWWPRPGGTSPSRRRLSSRRSVTRSVVPATIRITCRGM